MQQTPKRVGWATAPRLHEWREQFGFSQAELARRAQVSRATISRAEQGKRIAPKQADALAAVFGVPRARLAQAPDQEEVQPPASSNVLPHLAHAGGAPNVQRPR